MQALLVALLANTAVALALGSLAWLVWRVARHAPIAHALLLLALLKLVTPPVVGLDPTGWWSAPAVESAAADPALTLADVPRLLAMLDLLEAPAAAVPARAPAALDQRGWVSAFAGIWALGLVLTAVVTWRRARRCARLLACADAAPAPVAALVAELAGRLGLARPPQVRVVDASLSPFLWALGGRPTVVLSRQLLGELSTADLRSVLAHELAHLANRDHVTRWLELVVVAAHWWNPVAFALRALLREVEEVRCDARAVEALATQPRGYGRAILRIAAQLDVGPQPTPLGASGFGGPKVLKRRLTMIADNKLAHRLGGTARFACVAAAMALLPLGLEAQEATETEKKVQRVKLKASSGDHEALREEIRALVHSILAEHGIGPGGSHGVGDRHAGHADAERENVFVYRVGDGGEGDGEKVLGWVQKADGDGGDQDPEAKRVRFRVVGEGEGEGKAYFKVVDDDETEADEEHDVRVIKVRKGKAGNRFFGLEPGAIQVLIHEDEDDDEGDVAVDGKLRSLIVGANPLRAVKIGKGGGKGFTWFSRDDDEDDDGAAGVWVQGPDDDGRLHVVRQNVAKRVHEEMKKHGHEPHETIAKRVHEAMQKHGHGLPEGIAERVHEALEKHGKAGQHVIRWLPKDGDGAFGFGLDTKAHEGELHENIAERVRDAMKAHGKDGKPFVFRWDTKQGKADGEGWFDLKVAPKVDFDFEFGHDASHEHGEHHGESDEAQLRQRIEKLEGQIKALKKKLKKRLL